ISGLGDVTVTDSEVESIAQSALAIKQKTKQNNSTTQSQTAGDGTVTQTQSGGAQTNNGGDQTANGNSPTVTSGPINISGSGDVTVDPSEVKSIAQSALAIEQKTEQNNSTTQSQTAGDGTVTQSQSGAPQTNKGGTQSANSNSPTATSGPINISGLEDVTVDDSDVESIAEAGSLIGQLASQSNGNDQSQEGGSGVGPITQSQSQGDQGNSSQQIAVDNNPKATSSTVNITAGDDVAVSDSAVK